MSSQQKEIPDTLVSFFIQNYHIKSVSNVFTKLHKWFVGRFFLDSSVILYGYKAQRCFSRVGGQFESSVIF